MTPPSTRSPSAVHLHIEHLVLAGLPLSPAQATRFQTAMESELGRLLSKAPAGPALDRADARSAPLPPVTLDPGHSPAVWGRQIARSLYTSLARPVPILSHSVPSPKTNAHV